MIIEPMMALRKSSSRGVTLSPRNDNFPFLKQAHVKESVESEIALPFIRIFSLKNQYPECIDLPIKLSGHETYFLPEEWSRLTPILDQIIGFELSHNPQWREYTAYLSVMSNTRKVSTIQTNMIIDEVSCDSDDIRQYSLTIFDEMEENKSITKNIVIFNKNSYSFEGVESARSCITQVVVKFSENKISGKNKTYNSMLNYK